MVSELEKASPGIEEVMQRDAEFRAEAAASACDPSAEKAALQDMFEGLVLLVITALKNAFQALGRPE